MIRAAVTHLDRAALAACCFATCSAFAQENTPYSEAAEPVPLMGLEFHPAWHSTRTGALPWQRGLASFERREEPVFSVVTLPAQAVPGRAPGRAHHALSINNDASRQALRSLGLEVTECATRLRLPTRMRQTPGAPPLLDAQAQISWACRF